MRNIARILLPLAALLVLTTSDAFGIAQFSVINNTMEFDCLAAADAGGEPILDQFYGGVLELVQIPADQAAAAGYVVDGKDSVEGRSQHGNLVWVLILRSLILMSDPTYCLSGVEPLATFALLATGALLVQFPEVAIYDVAGALLGVYFVSLVYNALAYQGLPFLTFGETLFDTGRAAPALDQARIMTLAALGVCVGITHFISQSLLRVYFSNREVPPGTAVSMAVGLGTALTLSTLLSFQSWQMGPSNPTTGVDIFQYGLYHMLLTSMRHPGGWLYGFPAALIYFTRNVGPSEASCPG